MHTLTNICYLCGLSDPDSRDHVPARAIFYPRLPDDLMTAPAHRACQGAYNHDEAYFAAVLDEAVWQGHTAWMRRWAARPGKSGRKPAPEAVDVARMETVIRKIVQGLHFRQTGRLLPRSAQITIQPGLWEGTIRTASGRLSRRKPPVFQVRGNHDEFKYACLAGRNRAIWILIFHDRFMFRCEVGE